MPQISVRVQFLTQRFEEETDEWFGEALCFPEVTCLADSPEAVANLLVENVLQLLIEVPTGELHRRVIGAEVEPLEIALLIDPAERTVAWREPVLLKLPAVKWKAADDLHVVYIPALGIEVLANRVADWPLLVDEQVRAAIFRAKRTRSLRSLAELARCREVTVESRAVDHFVLPPKQQAQDELQPRKKDESVLKQIGIPLAGFGLPQAYERDDDVRRLADVLGGRLPRSALLVGPSGVGKTAVVRELTRRGTDFRGLWNFWSTSGSRIVSGMTGFGMWQERCEELRRELVKKRVILHVGSLLELMDVGKSEFQTQGIASFLRPALARGEILLIAECTPEQVSLIERQDVALLRAFQQVVVAEPTREAGRAILSRVARDNWNTTAELFAPEAIAEIDRLHRRFATYSAFPARPIRFLQNLRRDRVAGSPTPPDSVVPAREVTTAFARETGLPLWLLDELEPLDLVAAESWFARRVIGQPDAVSLVVDLLATLKAGLNREHKPLASFLFIGPTGVGKTEMAKTLAEFLFRGTAAPSAAGDSEADRHASSRRDDSRLIRIDMSEYADPRAVQRLIGGTLESEGVLTARVREQPFAVVLLDEFEKAHPSLFDLLLQILGEGRLTDAGGRLADFRNCVVIMTSNLGVGDYGRGSLGFGGGESGGDTRKSRDHFEKAVRNFVRPELFNRIDRIVPFDPLGRDTARKVVERQLNLVRQRDGFRYRRVTLDVDEPVIDYLLQHGFEPRYGARSLKRVIEQELLAPLAEQFNQLPADAALRAECRCRPDVQAVEAESSANATLAAGALEVVVKAQTDSAGRRRSAVGANASQLELVAQLQSARAAFQQLQSCAAVIELQNEVVRLERSEVRWLKSPTYSQDEVARRLDLDRHRSWLRRLDEMYSAVTSHEDAALMRLYGEDSAGLQEHESLRAVLEQATQHLRDQLFDLLDLRRDEPTSIRLSLIADDPATLRQLAAGYHEIAGQDVTCKLWQFLPAAGKREPLAEDNWRLDKLCWDLTDDPHRVHSETWALRARPKQEGLPSTPLLLRRKVEDAAEFLRDDLSGVLGLLFEFSGPRVFARFVGEDGAHRFVREKSKSLCTVQTALPPINEYLPPFGIERRGAVASPSKCREYDFVKGVIVDSALEKRTNFVLYQFVDVLRLCLNRHHELAAELLLLV